MSYATHFYDEPLLNVVLPDGTTAAISAADVAHQRECESATCINVWRTSDIRRKRFSGPYYALVGHGPRSGGDAVIRPADDWARQAFFPELGEEESEDDDGGGKWLAAFNVTSSNADRIRDGSI